MLVLLAFVAAAWLAALGHCATPGPERIPIRQWRTRDLLAHVVAGHRELVRLHRIDHPWDVPDDH